ncbi:hopanoid-associated sugar epimerase [Vulcanimicrobium alpinum]|uniref:hopanoid-associated sugar epimerase n=1 Tax=Vulcanimicrobium alpinum TaxID=3016050 RepID=UPI00295E8A42|nr:hopanoid-associated sugar epimerase [Vulcanimicrobium alpinum]
MTGSSGFVGANLVRALLDAGWDVRALVRAEAPSLDGLAIERVRGDLFAPHLADAMRGCDAVFHVAAHYSLWRRDRDALMHANVEGTRSVLAAARSAGAGRVVYTSSVAAIGVRAGAPADETYQSPPAALIGAYKRSKYLAEGEARRAVAAGQDVVIVNPTTPVGPWDAKPTPTGEIILRFLTGRMPAYVDTGLNLVDVGEVAAGHLAAYERGVAGERYILGSENVTLREMLARLAAITGIPAPRTRLPRAVPLAYAFAREYLLAPLGLPPDVSLESVRMAKQMMHYDATKAVEELGVAHRPVTPALERAVTWFRDHGCAQRGKLRSED